MTFSTKSAFLGLALLVSGTIAFAATSPLAAAERSVPLEAQRDLTLTVYQDGLALVHDGRWIPLVEGSNRLSITGISSHIQPESLMISSSADGLTLQQQSFMPADLTPEKLLQQAIGQQVLLIREGPDGEETIEEAELLSLEGGPVLRLGDRIEVFPTGRIALKDLPEGKRAKPALVLTLSSAQSAPAEVTLAYLTDGIAWEADYSARLDEAGELTLAGNLTLSNDTDAFFRNAALRLVAGDVSRSQARPEMPGMMMARSAAADMPADAVPGPSAIGDRYLYDTGRNIDLAPGERKQIRLFTARPVQAERAYRFEGLAGPGGGPDETGPIQASLVLTFENQSADDGDERPLPTGNVRVYERPAGDGPEIFAGQARIAHTPVGEEIALNLGSAFDVTARARQTAFERLSSRRYDSTIEITVANAKEEDITVEIVGAMPRDWQLLEESHPHEARTARQPVWRVGVPAGEETRLTYKVRVGRG